VRRELRFFKQTLQHSTNAEEFHQPIEAGIRHRSMRDAYLGEKIGWKERVEFFAEASRDWLRVGKHPIPLLPDVTRSPP